VRVGGGFAVCERSGNLFANRNVVPFILWWIAMLVLILDFMSLELRPAYSAIEIGVPDWEMHGPCRRQGSYLIATLFGHQLCVFGAVGNHAGCTFPLNLYGSLRCMRASSRELGNVSVSGFW
jgi:hypothetical protein